MMGLFKSIRETQKVAREISKDWDPGQQRRHGMARMQAAHALAQAPQVSVCEMPQS